jgi:LPS-assembly protein
MYIDQPLASGTGADLREELGVGTFWKFAENWSVSGTHTRDLQRSDGALNSSLTMTYQDDCLTFALIGRRDHVARSGLDTGDSIFFRLIFKNIGQFESPSFTPTFLPNGDF